MSGNRAVVGGLVALVLAGGVIWWASSAVESPPADDGPPIPVRPDSELPYRPYEYQFTPEQNIQLLEEKVKADPGDHLSLTLLGGLYLRKAKNDGNHALYDNAGAAFAKALKALPSHEDAQIGMALFHGSKHRFAEGLALASAVYKEAPDRLDALVVVSDSLLELGRYDEAEAALKELEMKAPAPTPPSLIARRARLKELHGDPEGALKLLATAEEAQRQTGDPAVNNAWYNMRRGEILLSLGRIDQAAAQLEAARADNPASIEIMAMLAHARSAQGRHKEAVALFEPVVERDPAIDTWLPFAHVLSKAGDAARAKEMIAVAEKADTGEGPDAVRDLILHYCETDGKAARALELARRELTMRGDVVTHDLHAWALLKNRKIAEAEKASAEALKLGTKDAVMLYHAGVIARAAGKKDGARQFLQRALAVNPEFANADDAKKLLAELG